MELDRRQRAMLQEMGIRVWQPMAAPAPMAAPVPATNDGVVEVAAVTPTAIAAAPAALAVRSEPAPTQHAVPAVVAPVPAAVSPDLPLLQTLDWPALAAAAAECAACGLCASRRCSTLLPPAPLPEPEPTVDTANAQCDWMVVGDVPDEAEDREAQPFAGNDGLLLDNILRALGVQRVNWHPDALSAETRLPTASAQRAYVTNVVKCRPAHGQIPQALDLAQCAAYLQREIALVQPRVIVALGRFAQQTLLGATPGLAGLPLGKLRATVHRYQGIPVVASYHPKQIMRSGADNAKAKSDAWADWCLAAHAVKQPSI